MKFFDIEQNEYVTVDRLRKEYDELRAKQPDEYNYDFTTYIMLCMTNNNGTLEIVREEA